MIRTLLFRLAPAALLLGALVLLPACSGYKEPEAEQAAA